MTSRIMRPTEFGAMVCGAGVVLNSTAARLELRSLTLPLGFFEREAGGACLESRAGMMCAFGRVDERQQPLFRDPEAVRQRDLTRTNVIAATTFDAIEQAVRLERLTIVAARIPMEL